MIVIPDYKYQCKSEVAISTIYDGLQYPRLLFSSELSKKYGDITDIFYYTNPLISLAKLEFVRIARNWIVDINAITPFLILI